MGGVGEGHVQHVRKEYVHHAVFCCHSFCLEIQTEPTFPPTGPSPRYQKNVTPGIMSTIQFSATPASKFKQTGPTFPLSSASPQHREYMAPVTCPPFSFVPFLPPLNCNGLEPPPHLLVHCFSTNSMSTIQFCTSHSSKL